MKSSGFRTLTADLLAAEPEQAHERERAHEFDERRRDALDQHVAHVDAAAAVRPAARKRLSSYFSAPNAFTT